MWLPIDGAWLNLPTVHTDGRGSFTELFNQGMWAAQINCSTSVAGVVRGLHFSDQTKYVTCVAGQVWDVIWDVRHGSPTFGNWAGTILDAESHAGVHVPAGVAHGFAALTDATVVYACDYRYDPATDCGVHPFSAPFDWPVTAPILSEKDAAAPTLGETRLPEWK